MKLLFVFILLPTLLISLYTGNLPALSGPDTVKVSTAGANNLVVTDSLRLHKTANDTFLINSLQGEIIQSGQNNSVEINTKQETPNNKRQITKNNQKSKTENQTTSDVQPVGAKRKSRHLVGATIKIKQTGKNNSVKINQR